MFCFFMLLMLTYRVGNFSPTLLPETIARYPRLLREPLFRSRYPLRKLSVRITLYNIYMPTTWTYIYEDPTPDFIKVCAKLLNINVRITISSYSLVPLRAGCVTVELLT